jgi:FecR protein
MDEQTEPVSAEADADVLVKRLLGVRLPPPALPADMKQRWADAFGEQLAHEVQRRKRRRWIGISIGIAAAALAGITLNSPPSLETPPAVPVMAATVRQIEGTLHHVAPSGVREEMLVDKPIYTDQSIATDADSAARIDYRGAELRMDKATRVRFHRDRLELVHGRMYVDSAPGQSSSTHGARITLTAGAITLRNTGTQFQVSRERDEVITLLREGSLELQSNTERRTAQSNDGARSLRFDPTHGFRETPAPSTGPQWDWIQRLTMNYAVEGVAVAEFLGRAAREAGMRLEYADEAARQHAERTLLHGELPGVTPQQAIDIVLATNRLQTRTSSADHLLIALE